MTSTGNVELQSVVKFCVALKKSPTKTIKMIESTGKHKQCSPASVYKWQACFRSGQDSAEDDLAVVMCSVKESVKDMINCERRTNVREIADKLDISVSTVHRILKEELGMSKVSVSVLEVTMWRKCEGCWV